jgi:hypothetical protein
MANLKKNQDLYLDYFGDRVKIPERWRDDFFGFVNESVLAGNWKVNSYFTGDSIIENMREVGIEPNFHLRTTLFGKGCRLYLKVSFEHGDYEYSKDVYRADLPSNSNAKVCKQVQNFIIEANNALLGQAVRKMMFSGDEVLVEIDGELRVVEVVKESCLGLLTSDGGFYLWEDVLGLAS